MTDELIESWIDVTFGMRGSFAVMRGRFKDKNGNEFVDNIQSSPINCKNRKEAIRDAKTWAEAEGIPCHVE